VTLPELLTLVGALTGAFGALCTPVIAVVQAIKKQTPGAAIAKIDQLHVLVNDRLTQLLALTAHLAHAEGKKEAEDAHTAVLDASALALQAAAVPPPEDDRQAAQAAYDLVASLAAAARSKP
jgi:hypothetical protein